MFTKYWLVVHYPTTNERKGPYETRNVSAQAAAEHIAKLYALKEPTVMIAVYSFYPSLEKPREGLLEAFMFSWELRPVARPVTVLPW